MVATAIPPARKHPLTRQVPIGTAAKLMSLEALNSGPVADVHFLGQLLIATLDV